MDDNSSNEHTKQTSTNDALSDSQSPEAVGITTPDEMIERYGSLFIALCFCYVRIHATKRFNDAGEYAPEFASAKELLDDLGDVNDIEIQTMLDLRSVPKLEKCHQWVEFILADILERSTQVIEKSNEDKTYLSTAFPIEALRRAFGLTELELLFVLCAVLVQYDDRYMRAFRYAAGVPSWGRITVGFIQKLIAFSAKNREDLHQLVQEDGPLLRYGLVTLEKAEGWRETPDFYAHVEVPRRVVSFLMGKTSTFEPIGCRWLLQEDSNDRAPFDVTCDEAVFAGLEKPGGRLAVLGLQAGDRIASVCRVAKALAMPALAFDLNGFYEALKTHEKPAVRTNLTMIVREVYLQNAILLVSYDTCSKEARDWLHEHSREFEKVFKSEENMRICLLAERQNGATRALFGEMPDCVFPKPTRDQQAPIWESCLQQAHLTPELAKTISQAMAKGYCLSCPEVCDAIEQTLARLPNATPEQALTADNLTETLNRSRGQHLEGLASLRSTRLTLDDIVLSPEIRKRLDRIMKFSKHRDLVMVDWDFQKHNTSGGGLCALFTGIPGTGKTMTALALANELGRALYVVDLSQVVDKYIGETEKRLAKIFDEAERSQAIILFDEADSLFATRTNVKSSNDRYANLEVNFLLQKIEAYGGVCILTSNFSTGLDEALLRRILFKIDFPMPDVSERAALWRTLIPKNAPVHDDISYTALARQFEMSGGHIKNAIFLASIEAAEAQRKIDHDTLWDAAQIIYRELGHMACDVDQGF